MKTLSSCTFTERKQWAMKHRRFTHKLMVLGFFILVIIEAYGIYLVIKR